MPDIDDRHILALAIQQKANVIITKNVEDFPINILAPLNIKISTPDDFLNDLFVNMGQEELIVDALTIQRARLKNPPFTVQDFLEKLESSGLVKLRANLLKFQNEL